jgi:hypothetical protein
MSKFNDIYYTLSKRQDGFGAQYHTIMSIIAFCKFNNYIYIHTPFTKMGHNVDINKLNHFIGINNDYLIVNNLMPKNKDKIISEQFSRIVHYHKNPSIFYTDEVLKIIRNFYYYTEKPIIENIDIAIHIRRGDVDKNNLKRYTDNNEYCQIIKSLKIKYPNYNITVFSEGKIEDFKELELNEKYFKLNLDICETFHNLVCAKILILAKSSFSYSAALLNQNIIYYQDFWHKPLNNWLNIKSLIQN